MQVWLAEGDPEGEPGCEAPMKTFWLDMCVHTYVHSSAHIISICIKLQLN